MASAMLWPCSAERIFIISRLSRSAERSKRYFHRWGRSRERQLFGEQTLSVRSRWSRPAPPKGELFAISRSVEQNLPLSGEVASRSDDGEGLPAFPQRRRFRRKQALQMQLTVTTPPVKMQSRSVRRRSGFALLKIFFPLFMRRATRSAFKSFYRASRLWLYSSMET